MHMGRRFYRIAYHIKERKLNTQELSPSCSPIFFPYILHRECNRVFEEHVHRRESSKPCPLDTVIYKMLLFISQNCHLHDNILRLYPSKLPKFLYLATQCNNFFGNTTVRLRSLLDRLIWLSCDTPSTVLFKTTFHLAISSHTPNNSLRNAARREFQALAAVLPLAQIKLHKKIGVKFVAFDASTVAAGMFYTEIKLSSIESLYSLAARGHTITTLVALKLQTLVRCHN